MIKIETKTMTKAIEKAKTVHPRVKVIDASTRTYSVTGTKGDNYTVKFAVANGHRLAECDCPARGLCYHIAAAAQVNVMTQSMRQAAPPVSASKLVVDLNEQADKLGHAHYGEAGNQWRSLAYTDLPKGITKDDLRKARFDEPITLAEEAPPWTVFFPSIQNYKAVCPARIERRIESDKSGQRYAVVRIDGWAI